MHYFFSEKGLKSIEPFLGDSLLAFDFDGTLAPIVKNPRMAALTARTSMLLKKLSRKAEVVLVSGRSVEDLKARSPLPLKSWIGNHGMEGLPGGTASAESARRAVEEWDSLLRAGLGPLADEAIENKKYSLTLHYRSSHNRGSRKKLLLTLAGGLEPRPRILPGKCVVNLTIPGLPHKGNAVEALLRSSSCSTAIFVGDDDTDEDVFRMRDPRIFSIRVGHRKGSPAQVFLREQKEVDTLLQLLLDSRSP